MMNIDGKKSQKIVLINQKVAVQSIDSIFNIISFYQTNKKLGLIDWMWATKKKTSILFHGNGDLKRNEKKSIRMTFDKKKVEHGLNKTKNWIKSICKNVD